MKKSKYTIFIPVGSRSILFNCRTDELIQVEKRLSDLYQKNANDLKVIKDVAPEFYTYLFDKGFIVENDIDEPQLILNNWKKEDELGTELGITINPTMSCNLRCWYCYEEHRESTFMNHTIFEAIIKYLHNQVKSKEYKHINISFFGGEPLLSFEDTVKPLMKAAKTMETKDIYFSWHFTTNATLLTQEIARWLKPFNPSFQITIDGDEKIHNMVKKPIDGMKTYRLTLEHIQMLLDMQLKVGIRFNYTAKTIERFIDVLSDIKTFTVEEKKRCNVSFHRIWQDNKVPYAEVKKVLLPIEEAFRKEGFFVISETSRQVGRCYGDVENSVVINYNGQIYKCTAREFDEEHSEGLLQPDGMIAWNERHVDRLSVRYGNKTCRQCILFFLCHGGCSQNKLESLNRNGCIRGYSEKEKTDYINQRIKDIYLEQSRKEEKKL